MSFPYKFFVMAEKICARIDIHHFSCRRRPQVFVKGPTRKNLLKLPTHTKQNKS